MTRLDEHRPSADGRYSRRSKLPCRWDCRRALVVLARASRSPWRAGPARSSQLGRASHGCDPGPKSIAHRLRQARRGLRARPAGPAGRPRGSKSAVFYPKSGKLPVRGASERRDAAPLVVRARRRRGFPGAGPPGAGLPGAGPPGAGPPGVGPPGAGAPGEDLLCPGFPRSMGSPAAPRAIACIDGTLRCGLARLLSGRAAPTFPASL